MRTLQSFENRIRKNIKNHMILERTLFLPIDKMVVERALNKTLSKREAVQLDLFSLVLRLLLKMFSKIYFIVYTM